LRKREVEVFGEGEIKGMGFKDWPKNREKNSQECQESEKATSDEGRQKLSVERKTVLRPDLIKGEESKGQKGRGKKREAHRYNDKGVTAVCT